MWIMGKIKKLFNTKIVLFVVAVLFFLKSAALGDVLPKKPNYLRIPVGRSRTYIRIVEMQHALNSKKLFTGTYRTTIDDQHRATIPVNLKEQVSGRRVVLQVVTRDLIRISDRQRWLETVMVQAPSDPAKLSEYRNRVFPFVYSEVLDKPGRAYIPEALREQTNFRAGSKVIITGVGDSIELMLEETFIPPAAYEIPVFDIDADSLFTGAYPIEIDKDDRVVIPSPLRKQLSSRKVILQFVNKDLIQVFDYERWLKAITTQVSSDPAKLSEYRNRVFPFVYSEVLDKPGRAYIPEALREQTNFRAGSKVIITGVGDRICIQPRRLSVTTSVIRTGI